MNNTAVSLIMIVPLPNVTVSMKSQLCYAPMAMETIQNWEGAIGKVWGVCMEKNYSLIE